MELLRWRSRSRTRPDFKLARQLGGDEAGFERDHDARVDYRTRGVPKPAIDLARVWFPMPRPVRSRAVSLPADDFLGSYGESAAPVTLHPA